MGNIVIHFFDARLMCNHGHPATCSAPTPTCPCWISATQAPKIPETSMQVCATMPRGAGAGERPPICTPWLHGDHIDIAPFKFADLLTDIGCQFYGGAHNASKNPPPLRANIIENCNNNDSYSPSFLIPRDLQVQQ